MKFIIKENQIYVPRLSPPSAQNLLNKYATLRPLGKRFVNSLSAYSTNWEKVKLEDATYYVYNSLLFKENTLVGGLFSINRRIQTLFQNGMLDVYIFSTEINSKLLKAIEKHLGTPDLLVTPAVFKNLVANPVNIAINNNNRELIQNVINSFLTTHYHITQPIEQLAAQENIENSNETVEEVVTVEIPDELPY